MEATMMTQTTDEQAAHDTILRWARSRTPGIGSPVMRKGVDAACVVIDLASKEPLPGRKYDWEVRDKHLAAGASWIDCLAQLKAAGFRM